MTRGTVLVHTLAGSPDPAGWAPTPGTAVCAMCARTVEASMPVAKALGANFTDPTLWADPTSRQVCAACTWCCAGRPPATIRGWTILAAPGRGLPPSADKAWPQVTGHRGLCVTNRSNPAAAADLLLDPPDGPWLCTVAVSGQKHTLPYARVNHGPGTWTIRVETAQVTATPARFHRILRAAARLRAAGHSAADITAGAPTLPAIRSPADLDLWRTHQNLLAGATSSGLLALALWCLTKTTIPVYTDLPEQP